MPVSRRWFLRSGAVVSAALAFKPEMIVFGQTAMSSNNASHAPAGVRVYSRRMFEPYVGDSFRVYGGNEMVDLRLMALTTIKPVTGITTGEIMQTDCFALRFHSERSLPATTTLYTLNHSKLGEFDLFMVQSKVGARILHTAIVNNFV